MAVVALITWIITAGIGFFMLSTWLRATRTAGSTTHFRAPVVYGHFLLAAAGLLLWIVYVVTDTSALAWTALVVLLVVGGIGDTIFLPWYREHRAATATPRASSRPSDGTAAAGTATSARPTAALAEQRIPMPAVVVHGIFAVVTIVLVFLAALD